MTLLGTAIVVSVVAAPLVLTIYSIVAPYRAHNRERQLDAIRYELTRFRFVPVTAEERVLEMLREMHRRATLYAFICGGLFGVLLAAFMKG